MQPLASSLHSLSLWFIFSQGLLSLTSSSRTIMVSPAPSLITVADRPTWREVIAIHRLIPNSLLGELRGASHRPSLLSPHLTFFHSGLPCPSSCPSILLPVPLNVSQPWKQKLSQREMIFGEGAVSVFHKTIYPTNQHKSWHCATILKAF